MYDTGDSIRLGQKTKNRKITNRGSIRAYMQMWAVLSMIHKLLINGKHITQREMFYCLIKSFKDQRELNAIIQDIVAMLHCPRQCLGLFATSRGFISGSLMWNVKYFRNNE